MHQTLLFKGCLLLLTNFYMGQLLSNEERSLFVPFYKLNLYNFHKRTNKCTIEI